MYSAWFEVGRQFDCKRNLKFCKELRENELKNIDLIEYYGNEAGFWKAFADGVENINIEDGNITMILKE